MGGRKSRAIPVPRLSKDVGKASTNPNATNRNASSGANLARSDSSEWTAQVNRLLDWIAKRGSNSPSLRVPRCSGGRGTWSRRVQAMDQDMRKWIEKQRQLAREGKLPKERLDVLALVDVPFERSCREEKGMAVDEDEEEEEEEVQDPDYDSEASDEDLDSYDTLESSYSDSATDSDDEDDNAEDWQEASAPSPATATQRPRASQTSSTFQALSSRRRGLFGNSARRGTPAATSTERTTTNSTATVGAKKRRRDDDAAKPCLPRSLQGSSRRSHSASSSPLKKWRTSSPDSADDIRPVPDGHNRSERDRRRGRRAPTERGESGTASVEESRHLAAAADAHAEEEFSSASDDEADDDDSNPLEEMSTLIAKAMYLESILDWI